MFEVFCGAIETMESVRQNGANALNPKTMKWQLINKNAQYEIREDFRILNEKGEECIGATLFSDIDLRKEAKEKGLIM